MQKFSHSPIAMLASFWNNRNLIGVLVKREVIGRYRGSMMGIAWSFFNPVLMLVIYTFVFSVVFKARWGVGQESRGDFAVLLFVGMIVHGIFAECINRAPTLILNNVNYVKKVVFPLDVLPWVAFGSALFHMAISLVVLLFAQLLINHSIPWTIIFFPLVILPLIFATMGIAWFLAALGVFARDIGQITTMLTTVLLFLSPVFYPVSALPEKYQVWLMVNPLSFIIEESRNTLVFGHVPNFNQWGVMLVISLIIAWLGYTWFQKTRKGFADVL